MTKRSTPEWIGKTADTAIPARVKDRIVERQGGKCAETGILFSPGMAPEFDHELALVNGGENKETNLRAVCSWAHKQKTKKDVKQKAKDARVRKKHLGIHKPKSSFATSRDGKFKQKIGGGTVLRSGNN